MILITEDGQRIYYEIKGNVSSGRAIIFLNGLTQSTQSWGLIIQKLEPHFKLILMDFIFQGQSDKEGPYRDFDQHAHDVAMLIEKEGKRETVVVGISYGSLVAQHLAVNRPDLVWKLVLISTFAHKTKYYEAVENAWWRALEMGGYPLMLDIMLPTVLSEGYFAAPLVPIEEMKRAKKDRQLTNDSLFKLMKATRERGDYRPMLASIKCPTLIIQGDKDLLLPLHLAEEVHVAIKGSGLHVVRTGGHTLNLEHTNEVTNVIEAFVNG